ncbi:SCP-like protein [Ancylostoma duodenale]|uniref:SCP-like protein n=1 Tax=Ancylostoma duodenale TaxID=51022 RepID=A0A0C2C7Z8_9BILA|nr:SCP-like protein [Ancylostoma duodenale]
MLPGTMGQALLLNFEFIKSNIGSHDTRNTVLAVAVFFAFTAVFVAGTASPPPGCTQFLNLIGIVLEAAGFLTSTKYQCWNLAQENDIRREYPVEVNSLREKIANGTAECKNGKCPQGKNIYRLYWDCILENYAQVAADECAEPKTVPSDLSFTYGKLEVTTCNPMPLFKKQVKDWWNETKTVGLDANAAYKPELKNFAVLANGLASRIGCAQRNCDGFLHMAGALAGSGFPSELPSMTLLH